LPTESRRIIDSRVSEAKQKRFSYLNV